MDTSTQNRPKMGPSMPKNPQLSLLNPYITCKICKGYFIDATTITECLHTFCRSCIVKHFKKSLFCPECDVQVERGCPLNKLRPDPRKQLLVYKVVPRLHENEVGRQWNFLKRNQPTGLRSVLPGDLPLETIRDRIVDKILVYSPEDKISLSVEYDSGVPFGIQNGVCAADKQINNHKRYLQCPAALTIYHLKKFIRVKYEINPQHKIMISYEDEPLPESSTLMDVAYQFFYEAKSPMRFTYRITAGAVLKASENFTPKTKPVPAKSLPQTKSVPVKPPLSVQTPSVSRNSLRGPVSSAASSSDESTTSTRRQQRQRSAKTAAYNALEAMEESDGEGDADPPAKRRRMSGKSPRWESDDSAEPFTVYRNTRRTPKATLEDLESRYNIKSERKQVYAVCSDDDLESSDVETKRNTIANKNSSNKYCHLLNLLKTQGHAGSIRGKSKNSKGRKKKSDEDVYEFDAQVEDNEDSNTTQEFDFVYDNSDQDSECDKKKNNVQKRALERNVTNGGKVERSERLFASENGVSSVHGPDDMQEVEADEHELEQHIEMEVITDTDDIEQHIEDSIEEVEVDVDEDAQAQADVEAVTVDEDEEETDENQLEAETTSSTCLVIAEDEDDDGVVEEVIAAEEDGHELVVVEDPDENDVTYTVEVFNMPNSTTDSTDKSEDASRSSSGDSQKSRSPTVEEDEPEIVHERVIRKKSKKSKHHHHHHHHKRRRHHSPVMLISSPEQGPMKLTLKLRPTPSISPGSSSSINSSKSPLPDSPTKEKKHSVSLSSPSRVDSNESGKALASGEKSYRSNSQKVYTVKITSPKVLSPTSEISEKKPFVSTDDSLEVPNNTSETKTPKPLSNEVLSPKMASAVQGSCDNHSSLPSASPKAAATYPRPPTPASFDQKKVDSASEKKLVPEDVKERLNQMRQVRHKNSFPTAAPASNSSMPDLKSVKTPSSLTISKVEAGESPPRPQETSKKPALEILMLPPSPPPSDSCVEVKSNIKSSESPVKTSKNVETTLPVHTTNQTTKSPIKAEVTQTQDQPCVLDLSDKTRKDETPASRSSPVSPIKSPKSIPVSPVPSPSPKSKSLVPVPAAVRDTSVKNDTNATSHNLNMIHNPLIRKLMDEATIATMNRMNSILGNNQVIPKVPLMSQFCANTQPTPLQTLSEIYGGRQISGFSLSPSPRPGPNQSVRHIPNPSALLHRQQSLQHSQEKLLQDTLGKQPGQLTEEQLKERLFQFQQNQAARANFTYSRVSSPGSSRNRNTLTTTSVGLVNTPTPSTGIIPINSINPNHNNNNNLVKSPIRSRSIEKVAAGLLSVRAGAYAVEAQVGH